MPVITLGAKDFVRGASSSDHISDAGFSTLNKGYSIIHTVGMLKPQLVATDRSNNTTDTEKVIAMTTDEADGATNIVYFVTEQGATGAAFFEWDGLGSHPHEDQVDGGARQYTYGKTDMVMFNGEIFVTSATDIAKLTNNLGALIADWWTNAGQQNHPVLKSGYPHPMIRFDKKLWIADKQSLHNWNGSTSSVDVLTLGSGRTITALGISQSTGDMLIAVTSSSNLSATQQYTNRILVWNGFSDVVSREIPVEGMITSFKNLEGITYVCYDRNFGYFNGNGITFLRELNIGYNNEQLIYPHKIHTLNNTIYIAEDQGILAYGKVLGGANKAFHYPYAINPANGEGFSAIGAAANSTSVGVSKNAIAIAYEDSQNTKSVFSYIDLENVSGGQWMSNKIYLPKNSRFVKLEAITETLTAGTINFNLYEPSSDSHINIGTMSFSTDGAINQKTMGRNKKLKTSIIQLQIAWSSSSHGIKQVKIYYETLEEEL